MSPVSSGVPQGLQARTLPAPVRASSRLLHKLLFLASSHQSCTVPSIPCAKPCLYFWTGDQMRYHPCRRHTRAQCQDPCSPRCLFSCMFLTGPSSPWSAPYMTHLFHRERVRQTPAASREPVELPLGWPPHWPLLSLPDVKTPSNPSPCLSRGAQQCKPGIRKKALLNVRGIWFHLMGCIS